MRRLVFFMHTSLDGFVAGPKGELDWININEEIFDFVSTMTDKADTALYGRVTYEMMQSYWPTAGEKSNASKHDKENILIFGSPAASHSLLSQGLVDEFWLFVNPVLVGQGIPLFKGVTEIIPLTLLETKIFSCGVIALHYETKQASVKINNK